MAKHETDDARRIPRLYDTGARAIICKQDRTGIGQMIALDETPCEPMYCIRSTESRRLMFRAHEVAAYSASRHDTLDRELRAIFAAFLADDEA